MATEAVIRAIMQQNLLGQAGQAFRGAQTFPLQLQQARQQLARGEQEQQIGDIWRRLQEAKLAGLPEELKAKREERQLTAQQTLATIGLRRAQTLAALAGKQQKATALEKFQQGLQRLQQFGDNDLQGRFLLGSGLSDAGFKIGTLGEFSPTGTPPPDTAAINTTMLQPHTSRKTEAERLEEHHQIMPPMPKNLTEQDKQTVTTLNNDNGKSRNVINSILAQPEKKIGEFEKGQLTQLNKDLADIHGSALHAAEHEKPLYQQLFDLVDELPSVPFRGTINWGTPSGQKFQALLAKAKGDLVKTFHLGRMTQREFDVLTAALGRERSYKSTLKDLFRNQLKEANQKIEHAKFYHDYVSKGGRSSEEAAFKWLNSIGEEATPPGEKPTEEKMAPKTTLSDEQLAKIAEEEGVPIDILRQKI